MSRPRPERGRFVVAHDSVHDGELTASHVFFGDDPLAARARYEAHLARGGTTAAARPINGVVPARAARRYDSPMHVQWTERESPSEIARRYGFVSRDRSSSSTLGEPPPAPSGSGGVVAAIVLGAIFVGVIVGERALSRLGG